jgi:hypothetical protein
MVTHAIDHGVPAMAAATVLSAAGLASLSGKVICGLVADRVGAKRVLLVGLTLQAMAVSLYLVTREVWHFYAVALVFGCAYGGVMPLYAIVVREFFGARSWGPPSVQLAWHPRWAWRSGRWPAAGCTTRSAATSGCSSVRAGSALGPWPSCSRSARPASSRPRWRLRAWPIKWGNNYPQRFHQISKWGRAFYNYEYNYAYVHPGLEDRSGNSVFCKDEAGQLFHTYSTFERGGEEFLGTCRILDVMPKGRDEHGAYHTLADWVRLPNVYGQGGMVEASGRYHAPGCACAVHT